jgi:hypothetical protein
MELQNATDECRELQSRIAEATARSQIDDGCSSNSRSNLAAAATLALGDLGTEWPVDVHGWMGVRMAGRSWSGAAAGREPYYGMGGGKELREGKQRRWHGEGECL